MSAAVAVNAHMRRASAVVVLAAAVAACAACGGQEPAVGARPATTQVPASEPAPAPSPELRPASTPELERSLFAAVRADDADAARAALEGGAAPEARGDGGRTPLVAAAKSNSVNTARVLVAAGADVNAKDDMEDSAFLYAGARSVVATLWPVGDDGAAVFAGRFYAHLKTLAPAEALVATQRQMAKDSRYGSPFYWAAYQVFGQGDPVADSHSAAGLAVQRE